MSDYGFGDPYFAARDRLSQVMRGAGRLSKQTSATLDPPLPLTTGGTLRDTPFRFIACGEVNAGKSSFLNALLGEVVCEASDLPHPRQPVRHHGHHGAEFRPLPGTEPCRASFPVLRDVEVIDTPGIRPDDEPAATTRLDCLAHADLAFCVFPVTNPWASASWNFLASLPEEQLAKVVLVIQQADQREPHDLEVMRQHVTDLARKRLDIVPPIFAVSAERALQAKQTQPVTHSLLVASGFAALHDFITRHLCNLDSRQRQLRDWLAQAGTALATVEDRIEEQSRHIRDQSRFMDEVEGEIDAMRESFIQRLPLHLVGVAKTFESEARSVSRLLHRKLGAARSMLRLFTGDRSGAQIESDFITRIQHAVEQVARSDSHEVAGACKTHCDELTSRVEETMGIQLTTSRPLAETLDSSQQHFMDRLSRAAEGAVGNLKVRNQLDKELRRRNLALKSFVSTSLGLTAVAAVCGILHLPWIPWILLALAAVFLAGGILTAWLTRKVMIREFKDRLLDTCGDFAHTLHHDYEEALRIVFKDYADTLVEVRNHLGREKLAIEPRQKAWQDLFLTLKTIEQDL